MADASTSPWIPLYIAGVGYALALVTVAATHFLTKDRERRARRAEFQQETLMELQDALMEFRVRTFDAVDLDDQEGHLDRVQYLDGVRKIQVLTTRIRDSKMRGLVLKIIEELGPQALTSSGVEDVERVQRLVALRKMVEQALERAGELIMD